jgi:hypothetical protein
MFPSYLDGCHEQYGAPFAAPFGQLHHRRESGDDATKTKVEECAMYDPACFNLTRCGDSPAAFRIHVYDDHPDEEKSEVFRKIFDVLKSSPYFTDDPDKACLFFSGVDTIDRYAYISLSMNSRI